MSDYIKREHIIKALGELCDTPAGQSTGLTALVYAVKTVDVIPAADVVERKAGHWRWISSTYDRPVCEMRWRCDQCNHEVITQGQDPWEHYCPNCGARMEVDA